MKSRERRLPALDVVGDGGGDQLVHLLRMADGELQPGGRAHRVAEHVGLLEADRVHEGGHVVGEVRIGDRPVDVGGAAVALELERIDLVGLGELRDDLAHRRDVHVGAVQHDQRIALAGDLVIHLHAVDLDALADRLGLGEGRRRQTSRAAAMKAVRNIGISSSCRLSGVIRQVWRYDERAVRNPTLPGVDPSPRPASPSELRPGRPL